MHLKLKRAKPPQCRVNALRLNNRFQYIGKYPRELVQDANYDNPEQALFLVCNKIISSETAAMVVILVLINNIFSGIAYPFAGPLGNGLRAAGDIRFTMIVSVILTVAVRLFFSELLGV